MRNNRRPFPSPSLAVQTRDQGVGRQTFNTRRAIAAAFLNMAAATINHIKALLVDAEHHLEAIQDFESAREVRYHRAVLKDVAADVRRIRKRMRRHGAGQMVSEHGWR